MKNWKKLAEALFWIAGGGLYILSMVWCFAWSAPVYPGIVGGVGICLMLIALGFSEERKRLPDWTPGDGCNPPPLHHNCRCSLPLEGESIVWKNSEETRARERTIHISMEDYLKRTPAIAFQIHQIVETPSAWDVRLGPDADDPMVSMSRTEFSTRPKLGSSILVIPPKVLGYLRDDPSVAQRLLDKLERDADERE